ncbi:replication initiation protein [Holzapfeliella sp. JNUCC 80]
MATNEITKYDKELNTIPLGKLNSTEMDIFFAIITRMKEQGDKLVKLKFTELQELSEFKGKSHARFVDALRKTYKKILTLNFGMSSKDGLIEKHFILFSEFEINQKADDPYVEIQVYDKALPLLNNLDQWVRYSLHEFNSLKTAYAKTLFRLLKQYRTTGKAIVPKDKFNELLAVPKSYRQSNINKRILEPSVEQLKPFFKNFKVVKDYNTRKPGKPLKGYTFTFTPEPKNSDDYQVKKTYKKPTQKVHKEIATDWSKKKAAPKTDINSVSDLLKTLDDSRKEEVKS